MLETFYRVVQWLIELELAIARSTGRNPAQIERLSIEWDEYDLLLFKLRLNK